MKHEIIDAVPKELFRFILLAEEDVISLQYPCVKFPVMVSSNFARYKDCSKVTQKRGDTLYIYIYLFICPECWQIIVSQQAITEHNL